MMTNYINKTFKPRHNKSKKYIRSGLNILRWSFLKNLEEVFKLSRIKNNNTPLVYFLKTYPQKTLHELLNQTPPLLHLYIYFASLYIFGKIKKYTKKNINRVWVKRLSINSKFIFKKHKKLANQTRVDKIQYLKKKKIQKLNNFLKRLKKPKLTKLKKGKWRFVKKFLKRYSRRKKIKLKLYLYNVRGLGLKTANLPRTIIKIFLKKLKKKIASILRLLKKKYRQVYRHNHKKSNFILNNHINVLKFFKKIFYHKKKKKLNKTILVKKKKRKPFYDFKKKKKNNALKLRALKKKTFTQSKKVRKHMWEKIQLYKSKKRERIRLFKKRYGLWQNTKFNTKIFNLSTSDKIVFNKFFSVKKKKKRLLLYFLFVKNKKRLLNKTKRFFKFKRRIFLKKFRFNMQRFGKLLKTYNYIKIVKRKYIFLYKNRMLFNYITDNSIINGVNPHIFKYTLYNNLFRTPASHKVVNLAEPIYKNYMLFLKNFKKVTDKSAKSALSYKLVQLYKYTKYDSTIKLKRASLLKKSALTFFRKPRKRPATKLKKHIFNKLLYSNLKQLHINNKIQSIYINWLYPFRLKLFRITNKNIKTLKKLYKINSKKIKKLNFKKTGLTINEQTTWKKTQQNVTNYLPIFFFLKNRSLIKLNKKTKKLNFLQKAFKNTTAWKFNRFFKTSKTAKYKNFFSFFIINFLETYVKKKIWIRVQTKSPLSKWCKTYADNFFNKHKKVYWRFTHLISMKELLEIILIMFNTHDLTIFLMFIKKKLEKAHFKKHKKILSILFSVLRKNTKIFNTLPIKGFSFDIRGKVGVSGNAKKRHLFFSIGTISNTRQNIKSHWQQISVWTPTGQMGITCLLQY